MGKTVVLSVSVADNSSLERVTTSLTRAMVGFGMDGYEGVLSIYNEDEEDD